MKYIDQTSLPLPPRKKQALDRRIVAVNDIPLASDKAAYIKNTNTWGLLKSWLSEFSSGKCWYCETRSIRAVSDVDHFRPKAGVTSFRKNLSGHLGYYWLAYDWKNFRFSCQRCNRPEEDESKTLRGKHNEFALCDEGNRNLTPQCARNEEPLLLDPCVENDTKLFAHLEGGLVAPSSQDGTLEYQRAEYTRDVLGLNSFGMPGRKREAWQPLKLLIELQPDDPKVRKLVESKLDGSVEYSSYFRSVIGSYREIDWVEALL
ncbi:hypothetical protein [Pseudomonas sp. URMO17WK12:I2]|uniref:hypothetical protein n=1 Tax=Pseudomonas sp. URMO17WK12:I2 TaxID=1261623 RepID=UPI000DB198AA|nr:hypothetical protein [Pseudomonas sp. URMO17WK12:I2]PZW40191.1 uncharacterized protein (TIGR02646 family) [Pseudomonas sp. URMO17WK12:I2]